MTTQVNANVVHESEAQRQHARVKIPARLHFSGADRTPMEVKLIDLSAGGLSFNAANQPFKVGDVIKGRLQFVIDNLGLPIAMRGVAFPWQLVLGSVVAALVCLAGRPVRKAQGIRTA